MLRLPTLATGPDSGNLTTPMRNDDEDEDEKTPAAPKDGGPSAMLIQKKFLEQRKIFLWGAVEDASARDIVEKLLYLDGIDPGKEITFYINTPGGSITSGMAVYDTIRMISSPVKVVNKRSIRRDFFLVHTQLLHDNALHLVGNGHESLLHVHPAVDGENLTSNIRRFV